MAAASLPLTQRPWDRLWLTWFVVHFVVITVFDSQNVFDTDWTKEGITYSKHTPHPVWLRQLLHDFSGSSDLLGLANPLWFVSLILLELIYMYPFLVFAIYAFYVGDNRVQIPGIVYASLMISSLSCIMPVQFFGQLASPNPTFMLAMYGPFCFLPFALIWRLRSPQPFAATKAGKQKAS